MICGPGALEGMHRVRSILSDHTIKPERQKIVNRCQIATLKCACFWKWTRRRNYAGKTAVGHCFAAFLKTKLLNNCSAAVRQRFIALKWHFVKILTPHVAKHSEFQSILMTIFGFHWSRKPEEGKSLQC